MQRLLVPMMVEAWKFGLDCSRLTLSPLDATGYQWAAGRKRVSYLRWRSRSTQVGSYLSQVGRIDAAAAWRMMLYALPTYNPRANQTKRQLFARRVLDSILPPSYRHANRLFIEEVGLRADRDSLFCCASLICYSGETAQSQCNAGQGVGRAYLPLPTYMYR